MARGEVARVGRLRGAPGGEAQDRGDDGDGHPGRRQRAAARASRSRAGSIVAEDIERGTLRRLFGVAIPSRQSYWFVSPREAPDAPTVRAFRDW